MAGVLPERGPYFASRASNLNCVCLLANIEKLLALEAKYGPLSGNTPAIDDVLNYLQQVCVL